MRHRAPCVQPRQDGRRWGSLGWPQCRWLSSSCSRISRECWLFLPFFIKQLFMWPCTQTYKHFQGLIEMIAVNKNVNDLQLYLQTYRPWKTQVGHLLLVQVRWERSSSQSTVSCLGRCNQQQQKDWDSQEKGARSEVWTSWESGEYWAAENSPSGLSFLLRRLCGLLWTSQLSSYQGLWLILQQPYIRKLKFMFGKGWQIKDSCACSGAEIAQYYLYW